MARRRFFVPELRRGVAELTGPDAEHLVRVLRAEIGQVYEISDNRDVYLAEIQTARKAQVIFRALEKLPEQPLAVEVTLFPALFKFDRFEWLVEKATELGAKAIRPWEAVRSERGLAQASTKRSARWEKIAVEVSQQARRAQLPHVSAAVPFPEVIEAQAGVRLLLDEDPDAPPVLGILPSERRQTDTIALLLGPEGGWTDSEREQAIKAGWRQCSLGRTILRAETAAIAGLSIVQAAWA